MIQIANIKHYLTEMGFALILTFIPLGMYFKIYVGNMIMGNVIMVLGMLFLFPYSNILERKIINPWNRLNIYYIGFFVLSYFYYYISSNGNSMSILTLGVSLSTCIALSFSKYESDFKIDRAIVYTWFFSCVCVVAGLFFVKSGMYDTYQLLLQYDENKIYDNLTASSVADINICCCLYLLYDKNRGSWQRWGFLLFMLFDFLLIIQLGKRTPLIVGFCIIIFWSYSQGLFTSFSLGKKVLIFIGVFSAFFLLLGFSSSTSLLSDFVSRTRSGLHDMIYGADFDATNSTAIRYNIRKEAIEDLSNFSIFELIFGRGYMYKWLDIPILQAYMDMGILGAVLMFISRVWLPLKAIFVYSKNNKKIMWASLVTSYGMMCSMSSGTPYDHVHWIPVACLIYVLVGEYKLRKISL